MNKIVEDIPSAIMEALVSYDWPGNIRQLQNFVEHGVIVSAGHTFQPALHQLRSHESAAAPKNAKTLDDATRDHILETLKDANWVVGGRHGAAARLGLARTTLLSKMRRLGIGLKENETRSQPVSRHAFAAAG